MSLLSQVLRWEEERTKGAPKQEPTPVSSWPARHSLTRSGVARLQRRGIESSSVVPRSPPPGPARSPSSSTGEINHESSARRLLEGDEGTKGTSLPGYHPKRLVMMVPGREGGSRKTVQSAIRYEGVDAIVL